MRRERKTQAPSKGEENRGPKERRKGQVEKERLGSESLVMFRQDQHSPWRFLSSQLALCFSAQTVSGTFAEPQLRARPASETGEHSCRKCTHFSPQGDI